MNERLFIGIDVGGTKIAGALVTQNGKIISRYKIPTPYKAKTTEVVSAIEELIIAIITEKKVKPKALEGIGLGIPGIVDSKQGRVIATPNINLSGCHLTTVFEKKFKTFVAIGNDVNVGLLGEYWLGAVVGIKNVVGIFPGTGLGGAVIIDGKLVTGYNGAAAEFGHMRVALDGPKCSCGNDGCLEAFASRWAIERDIRQAVKEKQKTVLTGLTKGDFRVIKSKIILEALTKNDQLVNCIVDTVATVLGKACISLRHIFDPERIVFGGGLIEACGDYILPQVRKSVGADPFFAKLPPCPIVQSELGDTAVILGAVALVQQMLGYKLVNKKVRYPMLQVVQPGKIYLNNKQQKNSFYIRADGKIRQCREDMFKQTAKRRVLIDCKDLEKICKKKLRFLIIGILSKSLITLTTKATAWLKDNNIRYALLPISQAAVKYNESIERKAIVIIK